MGLEREPVETGAEISTLPSSAVRDGGWLPLRRALALSVVAIVAFAGIAVAQTSSGTFVDDDGNIHEANIEAIAAAGITKGCDPVAKLYCPDADVTRAEMAAFLIRAVDDEALVPPYQGYFSDVPAGVWYTPYVERLYQLGITTGYEDGTYRPQAPVSRAEMAAFILRAIDEDTNTGPVQGIFSDVDPTAWYAPLAERMYALEITNGCAVDPLRYCPLDPVKRDQMASFLARALGLEPILPPPPTPTIPPTTIADGSEVTFGDGTWQVGVDIPSGTYRSTDPTESCYAARLSGLGGTLDDVIANQLVDHSLIVTIASTDAGFESSGCGTWSNSIDEPRTASPTGGFGDGYWFVGTEVAPGLWKNSDSSQVCRWERLSGFDWTSASVISYEVSELIQTVQVEVGDVGFRSWDCGSWSYLGE